MKNIINFKKNKNKILTVLFFIVIIILYIELNVLVNKFNLPEIDLSNSKMYSITEETKQKISSINKNVKIELYNFDEYKNSTDIENTIKTINKYSEINANISVEEKASTDYNEPTIVISSDDKQRILTVDDIVFYEESTQTYAEEAYDLTEQEITNAIQDVVGTEKNKVYLYINHSAYINSIQTVFSILLHKLDNRLTEIYALDLSITNTVPEDCKTLVIPVIAQDISGEEKEALISYINNGGNILLMQESNKILGAETPNFSDVLAEYGVSISDGIVMESAEEYKLGDVPGFIIPQINMQNPIAKDMPENSKMLVVDSAKINLKSSDELDKLNVKYSVLASASNQAFLRNDLTNASYTKVDSDEDAPNAIVAILIQKQINENTTSEIVVFANSIFATDSNISVKDTYQNISKTRRAILMNKNEELLERAIKYLTKNDDVVLLRKKYNDSIPTAKMLKNKGIVEMIFGMPMLIIIVGYIVWRTRKNKK